MSHEGATQITFIFTAGPDQVAEGDRIFASHAELMEKTHHREGELALLRYNVAKGPELSNPLDPASEPTENTCFVLTEVYANPAGLEDHWRIGTTEWADMGAFMAWAGNVDVAVLHGSPVIHSLW
jgi:quinol monooxygenase YgiN